MTARSIGEIAAGLTGAKATAGAKKVWVGDVRRTFQPVRRNSYHVGEREHTIWKPIGDGSPRGGRRFVGAFLQAAQRFELDGKQPGKVNGPLGYVALEVLRAMLRHVDYARGRLEPSIDTIMSWTGRSRAAVCAALARLKLHGFIDWIRRTEPLEDPDPFGPQVRQASNAYGIDVTKLPKAISGLLRRLLGGSPPPDDATWAQEQDAADTDHMRRKEPLTAWNRMWTDDEAIAGDLDKVAAALERHNASSRDGQNPGTFSTS